MYNIRFSRVTFGLLEDTGLVLFAYFVSLVEVVVVVVSTPCKLISLLSILISNVDGTKPTTVGQRHWHGDGILAADFLMEVVENGFKHSNKG